MAKSLKLTLDGIAYDQWTSGEVSRDLKDFSGSFSFTFRDRDAAKNVLPYASWAPVKRIRTQMLAEIRIGKRLVLRGYVEDIDREMSDGTAQVMISGRDQTGDLIDCSALVDGPAELKSVKLEDAIKKIAEPFGLSVRTEVDTGEVFERYSIDLGETAFSAIEKGARSRRVLILSDGVGGIVVTRTGVTRAPADLILPGNVIGSRGRETTQGRYSKTIVRGQSERSGKSRTAATLDSTAEPIDTDAREDGDGSATERERKGTVATGVAEDSEIRRYRPIVHLARSKADATSAQDEADWRSRTARGQSDDLTHTVKGFEVNGTLWTVNQLVHVSDPFQDRERDQLISNTRYVEDSSGAVTEITVCSPDAFDTGEVGNRRTNQRGKAGKTSSGALDSTAEAL